MPKVREGEKYEKKYSESDVLSALKAIENGMSQRTASKTFKVPRQTLQFRTGENFKNKTSLGPNTILTSEEESTLEEWIHTSYKKGFPVRKLDIQASVKEFLDANPRENPFNDNFPGDGWYRAFLKRHPVFTHRTPEGVTSASSAVSEADIRKWFSLIEDYVKSKGLDHILEDPTRIFNGDETCFYLCPKNFKVVAPRGARNVYEVDSGQSKTNITVMFTFSAAGEVTDPMIIYPYKRLPTAIINSVPSAWGIGHSENGWMKVELFYEYIGNVLHPYLKKIGTIFPIILFVDGNSTHQTLKLSQLCTELDIILIALYPNATRLIQPADVSAFKPLKTGWKKTVLEFRRKNPHEALTKERFAPVLKNVVEECAKVDIIKNGFRASGLYPWNASAIDFTKCLGAKNNARIEVHKVEQEIPLNNSLSFNEFKNIVGEDRIEIFERIEEFHKESNDEFILLYKLYKQFKKNDSPADISSRSERKEDNILQIGEPADSFEIIFEGTLPIFDGQELEGGNENNQFKFIEVSENEEQNIKQLGTLQGLEEVKENNQSKVTDVSGSKEQIMNHLEILQVDGGRNEENQDTERTEALCDQVNSDDARTITQFPNIEENKSKFSDYVLWPKTPERKGKKECERLPFVLTSTNWKKMQMDKLETKKQEEEKKEARKAERSLKKLAVEMKENENTKFNKIKIKPKSKNGNPENRIKKSKTITEKLEEFGRIYSSSPGPGDLQSVNIACRTQVVRNIFRHESKDENERPAEFSKNITAAGNLCFICTKNITNIIKGIRCYGCTRTFHNKCILKMNPKIHTNELFNCKTCLVRKNII